MTPTVVSVARNVTGDTDKSDKMEKRGRAVQIWAARSDGRDVESDAANATLLKI